MFISRTYQNIKLIKPFKAILQVISLFLHPLSWPLRRLKKKENSVILALLYIKLVISIQKTIQ